MYSYFYSNTPIFWDNDSENRPSVEYHSNIAWYDALIKNFNYVSWDTCTVNISTLDYYEREVTYFKIVNGSEVRYFLVSTTLNENKNTITLMLTLDVWATFTLNLFRKNENIDCLRNHIKNENAFQLEDNLLNSIPNSISHRTNYSIEFSAEEDGLFNKYTTDEVILKVDKDAQTSGNIYAIFNGIDGVSSNYIMLPMMSIANKIELQLFQEKFSPIATASIGYRYSPPITPGETINCEGELIKEQDKYNELKLKYPNAKVICNYREVDLRYMNFEDINVSGYANIGAPWIANRYISGFRNIILVFSYKKDVIISNSCMDVLTPSYDNVVQWAHPIDNIEFNFSDFVKVEIYKGEVFNTTEEILNLINNPNYINRFQGFYFGPNVLNIASKNWKTTKLVKNMVYFEMSESGIDINVPLFYFKISNKKDSFNSLEINDKLLMQFYNMSYFDNSKNWLYFLQETNGFQVVRVQGKLVFNGKLNIVANTSRLKVTDSIIEYPSQLPSITDSYVRYYSQSMSSVNTGLRQTEISANMGMFNSVVGGSLNAFSSALSNKKKKEGGSNGGLLGGIFSTAMNVEKNRRELRDYKESLSSKYEDIRRVSGAEIHASTVSDNSFILSNFGKKYGEVLQVQIPTDDTIRNLNNILYLFGNLNPMNAPINTFMVRDKFNYMLICDSWISTNIGTIFANATLAEKSAIAQNIAGGFRVWNIFPDLKVEN